MRKKPNWKYVFDIFTRLLHIAVLLFVKLF